LTQAASPPDFSIEFRAGLALRTARSTFIVSFIAGSVLLEDAPDRAPVSRVSVSIWRRNRVRPADYRMPGPGAPVRRYANKLRLIASFAFASHPSLLAKCRAVFRVQLRDCSW